MYTTRYVNLGGLGIRVECYISYGSLHQAVKDLFNGLAVHDFSSSDILHVPLSDIDHSLNPKKILAVRKLLAKKKLFTLIDHDSDFPELLIAKNKIYMKLWGFGFFGDGRLIIQADQWTIKDV